MQESHVLIGSTLSAIPLRCQGEETPPVNEYMRNVTNSIQLLHPGD